MLTAAAGPAGAAPAPRVALARDGGHARLVVAWLGSGLGLGLGSGLGLGLGLGLGSRVESNSGDKAHIQHLCVAGSGKMNARHVCRESECE